MICNTPPLEFTSRRPSRPVGKASPAGRVTLLGAVVVLAGCGRPGNTDAWVSPAVAVPAPAPPGSRYPNLAPRRDGGAVLSWVASATDGTHALQYSNWLEGGWTAPATVGSGAGWFVNWADFASVVPLDDGLWVAHWLEQRPGNVYAYDVRISVSKDHGRTWSAPISPHDDGTPTEHGFVSLAPSDKRVAAIWLDGRNTAGADHESGHVSTAGAMTLRTALIDAQGRVAGGGAELDARVCDCCQTDAAATAEGLVVAYRDRDAEEIRDISVVRAVGGVWSAPVAVHRDNWRIAACPVNGPAIAAQDRIVAVAWFTAPDQPRIRLAFSDDAGQSFALPLEIAAGRVAGRVDLVLLDHRRAVVSWLAEGAEGAEIRAQVWTRDGAIGAPLTIASASVDRASGFPRMARAGEHLLFAWTEAGESPAVRTAVVHLR